MRVIKGGSRKKKKKSGIKLIELLKNWLIETFKNADPSDYATIVMAILISIAGVYLMFMLFIATIVSLLSFIW